MSKPVKVRFALERDEDGWPPAESEGLWPSGLATTFISTRQHSVVCTRGDDVRGGDGADVLRGDAGDDRLEGGGGFDRFFGGPGRETIVDRSPAEAAGA